jgi:hypothetical protein
MGVHSVSSMVSEVAIGQMTSFQFPAGMKFYPLQPHHYQALG